MWPVAPVYWCGFRFSDNDAVDREVKLFVELCIAANTALVPPAIISEILEKIESYRVVESILDVKVERKVARRKNILDDIEHARNLYIEYFGIQPPPSIWGPDAEKEIK